VIDEPLHRRADAGERGSVLCRNEATDEIQGEESEDRRRDATETASRQLLAAFPLWCCSFLHVLLMSAMLTSSALLAPVAINGVGAPIDLTVTVSIFR
jgi:hypothetical protein